jgi:hypothetical protein
MIGSFTNPPRTERPSRDLPQPGIEGPLWGQPETFVRFEFSDFGPRPFSQSLSEFHKVSRGDHAAGKVFFYLRDPGRVVVGTAP